MVQQTAKVGDGCGCTGCGAVAVVVVLIALALGLQHNFPDISSRPEKAPASPAPAVTPPRPPPPKGDRVKLVRDAPLYFQGSVYRRGKAGDEFEVLDYEPEVKTVSLLSRNAEGMPIGLTVSETDVSIVLKSGAESRETPPPGSSPPR